MRAVYQCLENPYLTLSLDEIVPLVDAVENADGGTSIVWLRRNPPISVQFMNGTLVLTDPAQIRGVREYIGRRQDNFITELSVEGDEVELECVPYPPYPLKPKLAQDGSEAAKILPNKREIDRSDDWDRTYEKMLKNR